MTLPGDGAVRRLSRAEILHLTPYEDVNAILADLADGVVSILGDALAGLYLTGSLTYGDFDRGSSDIDFLAVLQRRMRSDERNRVAALHAGVAERHPVWAERIEGSYITEDMLDSIEPPATPRPYINGGAFWDPDPRYGNEWLINLYALRDCGVALAGPEPVELVPMVDIDDVRAASRRDLLEEWLPTVDDPEYFRSSHIQAYVTLTLCRIMHRDVHDRVVSKRVAARWVRETVPEEWVASLVERAKRWQHGEEMDAADEVRQLILFTRDWMERNGHYDVVGGRG